MCIKTISTCWNDFHIAVTHVFIFPLSNGTLMEVFKRVGLECLLELSLSESTKRQLTFFCSTFYFVFCFVLTMVNWIWFLPSLSHFHNKHTHNHITKKWDKKHLYFNIFLLNKSCIYILSTDAYNEWRQMKKWIYLLSSRCKFQTRFLYNWLQYLDMRWMSAKIDTAWLKMYFENRKKHI